MNLASLNFKRWGGEHNRPGNDGGCFASALDSVRQWGGVLEHPADSHAWAVHGLPAPVSMGWQRSSLASAEWVCEVWQSAYGHKARKRTWLFASMQAPPTLDWRRQTGTHQCGKFDRNRPTLEGRKASATPESFREVLLSIARAARPTPAPAGGKEKT